MRWMSNLEEERADEDRESGDRRGWRLHSHSADAEIAEEGSVMSDSPSLLFASALIDVE